MQNIDIARAHARGFTLIELVVVITIVGILAAVALPRFANMQQDARIAKTQALYGAVRSAAALAHSRCLLDVAQGIGTCTTTGGTANMDGLAVAMTNQYPSVSGAPTGTCAAANRTYTGIIAAAQISDCNDGVAITTGTPTLITINGAATAANCRISYTAAAANAAPTITVDTTGC